MNAPRRKSVFNVFESQWDYQSDTSHWPLTRAKLIG